MERFFWGMLGLVALLVGLLCGFAAIVELLHENFAAATAYSTFVIAIEMVFVMAGMHESSYWVTLDRRRRVARDREKARRMDLEVGYQGDRDEDYWNKIEDDEALWYRGACRAVRADET